MDEDAKTALALSHKQGVHLHDTLSGLAINKSLNEEQAATARHLVSIASIVLEGLRVSKQIFSVT
jgi:hypothetical protein